MLAVAWPFGFPARFADPGGAQTRCAQTMRAFSPESPALLGHTTRPEEISEARGHLIIIVTQLAELVLSHAEGVKQGPTVYQSVYL